MSLYKVTIIVEANSRQEALEEVGYRIHTHQDESMIEQRVKKLEIERIEEGV